jgi:hypothetical protein
VGKSRIAAGVDPTKPNVARIYDYLLGGKDHFVADRWVAERMQRIVPDAPAVARANRAFVCRVVRHMVAETEIDQLIDVGCGLPTRPNVHEIARAINPLARTVYLDNDPLVLTHGRALLAHGHSATVVTADVRAPEKILHCPAIHQFLDLRRPVGLLLFGVLHLLDDADDLVGLMACFRAGLAAGSHVAVSHLHNPGAEHPESAARAIEAERLWRAMVGTVRWRSRTQIRGLFAGMELLEPGLVPVPDWRPEPAAPATPGEMLRNSRHTMLGGVARLP